jgi:hypothetical protein
MVLLSEGDERNECPDCEHPWFRHGDHCEAGMCPCANAPERVWALTPAAYIEWAAVNGDLCEVLGTPGFEINAKGSDPS